MTLLIGLVPLVSASNPAGLGTPTLHVVQLAIRCSEIVADGITNGGIAGNGAFAWTFTIWFTVLANVALGDIQATAGPRGSRRFATSALPELPNHPLVAVTPFSLMAIAQAPRPVLG